MKKDNFLEWKHNLSMQIKGLILFQAKLILKYFKDPHLDIIYKKFKLWR